MIERDYHLKEVKVKNRIYKIDTIMPDWIEAHSGICFGEPTLIGHRLRCSPHYLEDPADYSIRREQALVLAAFCYGVEWQRSRKRRARMEKAVKDFWKAIGDD